MQPLGPIGQDLLMGEARKLQVLGVSTIIGILVPFI
jgi:hypothetical protein